MDANCTLMFDEHFEDKIINDRGIECDYERFSGGERKRIDLAILFAFSDLRRLQGDVSFNLGFYDELLDSAISVECSAKVFEILKERYTEYNESSYIITHKTENLKNPNIDAIIYLVKSGGITKIKDKV
jgi:Fe-S cluster assembly ATPase SufC